MNPKRWVRRNALKKRAIQVRGNFGALWPEDKGLWPMETVENALKVFLDHDEATIILGLFSEHQIVEIVRNALDDAYNAETYRLIKEAA